MKNLSLMSAIKFVMFKNSRAEVIQEFLSGSDIDANTNEVIVNNNTALKYSVVFGCLRVLAETFACVPIKEYKKLPSGDRAETDDTGLYDILHNVPNDEMSAFSFKEMSQYQINTGGNLVCQRIVSNTGDLIGLNPFRWERVKISRHDTTRELLYSVSNNCAPDTVYKRKDIFHVNGPSFDGIIGMSPIECAASAIKLGVGYEKFGINFYKNGAFPSGFFEHQSSLKDESYKRLKQDIAEKYQSLKNVGTPMLLEDNLKFNGITMKLIDAELLDSKKFQIEEICRFYRVPLHLVQNLDRATNNNIEHQSLEFAIYTMLPIFKRFEDAVNTQLLTKDQRASGYYFEFNMSALLRGDQKSMAEAFAIGRQWGWLSVNDIRRMLNLPKVANGDVYLQPMNMVEAGTVTSGDQYKNIVEEMYKLMESRPK